MLFLHKGIKKMKYYIMIAILFELLQNDIVKTKDIATKYEISTRTIYRYLDSLESAGIPTITIVGKNGGIKINPKFRLYKGFFTQEEKELIIDAIKNKCGYKYDIIRNKLNIF